MGAVDRQLEQAQPDSQPENDLAGETEEVVINAERIVSDAFERIARSELNAPTKAEQVIEDATRIVDAEFDRIAQAEQPELLVENPAYSELAAYETIEDFEKNINNFLMFFQDGLGEYYRDKPCWARFEMLHEELAESLRSALANYQGDFYSLSPQQKHQVFKAYGKMAELVDKTDPYVCDQYGHVDAIYLNR